MAGKYTNISIHFPEEFKEDFKTFKSYIKIDPRICDHSKARKGKLISLTIRLLIKQYNRKFGEWLLARADEREEKEKQDSDD